MKNKLPNIVTIAILTVTTVLFWVFFTAYRAFTKEAPAVVPEEILAPLDPNLDKEMLGKIKNRYYIEEGQAPTFDYQLSSPSPLPEEISSPEQTSSPSATIVATESAYFGPETE
jgi:hypothetical protein